MKNVLGIALGIFSAIGGFVDIGDLVFNMQAGATFGFQLLWVVVVGVVGIIVYSEMCGRVSAASQRPVFDLIRERTGYGPGLTTLIASQIVNLMTCAAEVGGVAICLHDVRGEIVGGRLRLTGLVAGTLGRLERYGIGVAADGDPALPKAHGHPVIPWRRVVRVGREILIRDE